MVFKKLSKKIMAYTLTTAMALGFFAVSDINLTTAWATAASNWPTGAMTADVELDGDKAISEGTDLTSILNGHSIDVGEHTVTISADITLTLASGVTITGPASSGTCTFTGGKISATGITGGTITGGTITGGTVKESKLEGSITLGDASKITTLQKCKVAQSAAATLTTTDASANIVLIKDSLTGSATNATTLKSAAASNTDCFQFDNATVSGKFIANATETPTATADPIIKGNIKASSLDLSGEVVNSSNAVITLKDGTNKFAPYANDKFTTLTLVRGADFNGNLCKATITAKDVSSNSAKLFKYLSTDEANFADGMLKGNIVATSDHTDGDPETADQLDANGYGAHLQGGYVTYGVYDFDYDKSGRNVDVTCVAKGNKHDGTKFSVSVKPNVGVGIAAIGSTTDAGVKTDAFDKNGVLVDYSKVPSSVKTSGLWEAFGKRCVSNASHYSSGNAPLIVSNVAADNEYYVHFLKEGTTTPDINLTGTVSKIDISKAVVNGLHANGIDSYDEDSGATNYDANVAKVLPDDFVSIEMKANYDSSGHVLTAGTETTFKTGVLNGNGNVYLVYKTADGHLKKDTLQAVNGGTEITFETTAGTHTLSLTVDSTNYTGEINIPYEIVDESTETTYSGDAQSPSITGATTYSTDGSTYSTTAPSFTDAGTYKFNYKDSNNAVKKAVYIIKPASVTPQWNINPSGTAVSYRYDGKAKTRTVTGVTNVENGSLPQNVLEQFDLNGIKYTYLKSDKVVDSCVNTGTYTIKATADRTKNKNFKLTNVNATLTITSVDATVTSKKECVVYADGSPKTIDKVTINAPEGSYKVTYCTTQDGTYVETIPTFTEEGTYKVYYHLAAAAAGEYTGTEPVNVNITGSGYVTLIVKPALSMKRTDSTKSTETYTGKAFPIKADAYSGTSKESDVEVVFYIDKGDDKYTKITDGIKAVGTYPIVYAFEKDGKALTGKKYMGTITIKAAAKKSIAKATVSVKNVTYNANKQTAKVTVKYGNTTLKLNKDYTLKNATHINAGSFKVTITGKGNYTGTKTVTFKIAKRKVTKGVVTVKRSKKTFTVYVKIGKKNYKVAKTNYKLTSKYNKKTKKYAVTVAFKVNYSGTVKKTVK